LQWARRRGPGLNHAQLHSLFRKRQIKLFLPATAQIKSISERTQLPEGSQLLFPKQATAGQPASRLKSLSRPDLTTKAAFALAELLRQSVLHKDDELLVINKPAGLAVQGGPKVKMSLDKIMGSALSFGSLEQPRLVHRLDRDASGCLVIARTADSAAWLSQAFAQHATAASNPGAAYK
ncbi:MAG: ribosomal large subunit pseudouridine synthase C, partial [Trebouxia sp. A1-2]